MVLDEPLDNVPVRPVVVIENYFHVDDHAPGKTN